MSYSVKRELKNFYIILNKVLYIYIKKLKILREKHGLKDFTLISHRDTPRKPQRGCISSNLKNLNINIKKGGKTLQNR